MTEVRDDLPAAMAPVIDQMLAPDPADRPDAGEILSQFRRILPATMVRPRTAAVRTRSTRLRLVSPNT
jgi:hypothetical protein